MKGFTLWFTGLPCSGKSTLAEKVKDILLERGKKVEVLDGDVVRTNLSKGLGFSKEDRDTNILRIGFVCHLLSRNGAVAIGAAISPYREIRRRVREMVSEDAGFVEVFVKTPVEVCERRDIKGMWAKARAGEMKNFTGIDDPYEEPLEPEVVVETDKESVDESVARIISALEAMNYIPSAGGDEYTAEEEKKIKERLKALGYI